jgi:hypothetical protein
MDELRLEIASAPSANRLCSSAVLLDADLPICARMSPADIARCTSSNYSRAASARPADLTIGEGPSRAEGAHDPFVR